MPAPIHEHPHGERVNVGGLQLEGWLAAASCTACRSTLVYYVVYDALFCPECNAWAVVFCEDASCMYCRVRPPRPRAA